jgi:hypothetical protein
MRRLRFREKGACLLAPGKLLELGWVLGPVREGSHLLWLLLLFPSPVPLPHLQMSTKSPLHSPPKLPPSIHEICSSKTSIELPCWSSRVTFTRAPLEAEVVHQPSQAWGRAVIPAQPWQAAFAKLFSDSYLSQMGKMRHLPQNRSAWLPQPYFLHLSKGQVFIRMEVMMWGEAGGEGRGWAQGRTLRSVCICPTVSVLSILHD